MRYQKILTACAVCMSFLFFACNNEGDAARDAAVGRVSSTPAETPAQAATPTTPEPAQNAAGIWHYTCPNGCAGGAGTATACSNCGSTLAHNQAYHQQPTQTIDGAATSVPEGFQKIQNPLNNPTEPPQNAAGVWHYTCPNGCEGGAGTATACSKCGGTLAHNQAYHQ